jgi:two-component system LytT family sensor kinase
MKKVNSKIGFNDKKLMLIAIPVLSFIVPVVFFGCRFNRKPYLAWDNFLTTFFITLVLWKANRHLLIWCRTKYPLFADVKKRLLLQMSVMLIGTVIGNNILHLILNATVFKSESHNIFDSTVFINSNAAAIFCVLIIIGIYESIYFINALKESVQEKEALKRESLNAQLETLRTQVNPHFLFNNLNTLASLIPENPTHAVDFVQQLSKVYRYVLEVKDEKSIPLQDELDVVKAYTFLLQTRFGKNLEVNIDIPKEKLQSKIVPLSLQMLMENAIKHNIVSADKPLTINIFSNNGHIVVDNTLQMKKQLFESTGIGLDNIRNRCKFLGTKQMTVTETETNFTVSIPLIEQ